MDIDTRHFGNVTIEEDKIIAFADGIFGFEELKEFIVLYDGREEGNPFAWLQAIKDKDVCLPLINPMAWYPDYEPEVDDEKIDSLELVDQADLDVYTVVVIPEDIKAITTNLKAPILINRKSKLGMQVIVNDDAYNLKHNLYEQMEALKKAGE